VPSLGRLWWSILEAMELFGIEPKKTISSLRRFPQYSSDLKALREQMGADNSFPLGRAYPCLHDRFSDAGSAKGHYFHQDLLVARRVHLANPQIHVDVGSRIDGFVAHVASFRPITVVDIRPMSESIPNIAFAQGDLMGTLPDWLQEYCDSLSCLHALEHFGLGRYGDPVRFDGHIAGFENLYKILKPLGTLYFSVPIGPQRIEFNAHRVFSVNYLLGLFSERFAVQRFSLVDDKGRLSEDVDLSETSAAANFGCTYGCGIFELRKLAKVN